MFIQTEATPNPSTLKFIPGLVVLENGSLDFRSPEESRVSPLAERLFAVEGVAGVFLSQDFIAITKNDDKEWFLLKPALLGGIMEHFTAGRPVIDESDAASQAASGSEGEGEADDEVVAQIKALLDKYNKLVSCLSRHIFAGLTTANRPGDIDHTRHMDALKRVMEMAHDLASPLVRIMTSKKEQILWGQNGAEQWMLPKVHGTACRR